MTELEKLITECEKNSIPDYKIDYSDIPEVKDFSIFKPLHPEYFKPTKTSINIRIDSDVLAWFKAQGKGYQTKINEVLRSFAFNH